jgi:hypothetical protein
MLCRESHRELQELLTTIHLLSDEGTRFVYQNPSLTADFSKKRLQFSIPADIQLKQQAYDFANHI